MNKDQVSALITWKFIKEPFSNQLCSNKVQTNKIIHPILHHDFYDTFSYVVPQMIKILK